MSVRPSDNPTILAKTFSVSSPHPFRDVKDFKQVSSLNKLPSFKKDKTTLKTKPFLAAKQDEEDPLLVIPLVKGRKYASRRLFDLIVVVAVNVATKC